MKILDIEKIRADFPILRQSIRGRSLVYLDNAATSQKPRSVIEAIGSYYSEQNANVHRGVHYLSEKATEEVENVRVRVKKFIKAQDHREVIFVRGTTEAINLVAQSYGRAHLQAGDEVMITEMEHHSNIVPWQIVCEEKGARLKVAPIDDAGDLELDLLESLFSKRTRLVALSHISNVLGTINPVKKVIEMAHRYQVPVLIDGAQAVPHMNIDVQDLDCDFYAFSGHKMYGPTGIGVLYGKRGLLEAMPPYQGGGDMIRKVTFEGTEYNDLPYKFEAGTPHIAGIIGLGAAVDYIQGMGLEKIAAHENELLQDATQALQKISGVEIIGKARDRACVLSFVMEGVHPHDVGTIIDQEGVAIRVGHHCAMPLMKRLGVPATARASFAVYNSHEDIQALVHGLRKVREVFGC
ncbi:MAG: cysteine sulfinate desulfinase [Deltaproteobacteria bacterium RIFCSPLOWO2_02_FULL_50_16]|nr:MAG: cysteine sulfinate desulfinase [Deltaproteobacteria bacterium GWA2_50_8]OGQ27536.1 MAG: cysteine sulfinate desulfinase [Deltaproteobacteria bacterium RIFCSPHIGHO2_02_FULL_50_15]OGQ56445.1 MAG: cysteine sulfinate desulfinase [Deltaproteobacteria bacterium RIFCSPLOWO2_02_FULL_50_16]OGQ66848.1 MAG: cysteine sulfinate desulfinase [Deltaproteobacteria bacterium RIFCSPLOWO2_12_FULL_50_11]